MIDFSVRDEAKWALQEREFNSSEGGKELLKYTNMLLSRAERFYLADADKTAKQALDESLEEVEGEYGNASIYALARVVLVTCWHWQYGEELFGQFSNMEKKFFTSAAVDHIEEAQESAKRLADQQ